MYSDTAGAKEVAFCTNQPIVVSEWTWVLLVSEPDVIMVSPTI